MPCGCIDNKLNDNKSLNKDKLSLDTMKGLSIDEITSLYRQGYVLENTESVESGIVYQSISNIESMTYGTDCTGSIVVDRHLESTGSLANMTISDAVAQRFVPTSRCLKSVTLRLMRVLDNDVYVEIRTDSGGSGALPVGNPQTSGNRIAYATIPWASIPTSLGEVTVPLNIILPDTSPVWIVTCLYAYDAPWCASQPCDTSYYVDGGGTGTGTSAEYRANKYGVDAWTKFGSLWFKTNKQTYGPPAPALQSISVTPTSASVNVGTPQQLTAVCIDQYSNTMNCPILAWASSDITKATVSPSGLVTGIVAGSTSITAHVGTMISNPSVITVSVPSQVLGSIIISPASQLINIDGIVQLTAVCKDTGNATMTCPTLAWASSNPAIVSVDPLTGLITGVSTGGPVNITAHVGTMISNPSVITVTGIVSTLTSIVVSPPAQSINVGSTVRLTAVCKDLNVATMTCPSLTWASSNNAKATVNSSGLVTGVAEGITNVTASAGTVTSNTSVITVTTTPPPQAGGGGVVVIAAVALIAAAMFMARKPPTPPT